MSITQHYDKTASIQRLQATTGNKQAFTDHLETNCLIQPLTDEVTGDLEGSFGKDFLMLSPLADIREGDKVAIDDEIYRVVATEALNFGRNQHQETRLRIFN